MSNGRVLKCDLESSQVVLCDVSEERNLWVMNSSYIVCKRTSQLMYLGNYNLLHCSDNTKSFKWYAGALIIVAMVKTTYLCRYLMCFRI